MSSKAPEEWISFLLTVLDYTPAKPDWKAIANDTGVYKSAQCASQAYNNMRKKHFPLATVDGANVPATPSTQKKRTIAEALPEDMKDNKPKRGRPAKKPKKNVKDEQVEEKANVVKLDDSDADEEVTKQE